MPRKPADPHYGLTDDEFKRFASACQTTFNYISADLPENMPRSHVIEMVLDAGRCREHGGGFSGPGKQSERVAEWRKFYDERIEPIVSANYGKPKFNKMMKEIFPHSRY